MNESLKKLMTVLQDNVFVPIAYLLYSAATLLFFYGLLEFIMSLQSDKSDKREAGKRHMLYGTIGLLIMLSVKGIIYMIMKLLGITDLNIDIQ